MANLGRSNDSTGSNINNKNDVSGLIMFLFTVHLFTYSPIQVPESINHRFFECIRRTGT